MTLESILQSLYDDLLPWVKQRKGTLSIATDPYNVLELLVAGPAGLLVILHYAGDDEKGEQAQQPLADNILEVTLGYNLGLQSKPDLSLMKSDVKRTSLLKHLNDCRARVLSFVYPEDETMQRLEYAGCESIVLPAGIPLAAYKFRVKLTAIVDVDEELRGSIETTEG